EGDTAPLECGNIGESVLKHFRGHILSFMTILHTPGNERVNALKVPLIQLAEPPRILLGGLDQQALVVHSGHHIYKGQIRQKVTARIFPCIRTGSTAMSAQRERQPGAENAAASSRLCCSDSEHG